jgi:hypothetical protein
VARNLGFLAEFYHSALIKKNSTEMSIPFGQSALRKNFLEIKKDMKVKGGLLKLGTGRRKGGRGRAGGKRKSKREGKCAQTSL